jgi:hypothetical protein
VHINGNLRVAQVLARFRMLTTHPSVTRQAC